MEKNKGFKALNKDMTCNGFKFEEGKTYEENNAVICKAGFHFCKDPFDVLNYYNIHDSEFHLVEAVGEIDKQKDGDSKRCTTKIKIGIKLGLSGFVKSMVKFLIDLCKDKFQNDQEKNYAQIGSSGDYAQIGSSGDSAKIGSSGYSAKIGSSGDSAHIEVEGLDSVCASIGFDSKIKAKKGNWITLAEWKYDDTKERYIPFCVKSAIIDGEVLKEDTLYKLKNGDFVAIK